MPRRAGKLDAVACEELGVRGGKDYARLKLGETVTSRHGTLVHPEQVTSGPLHIIKPYNWLQ